MGALGLMKGFKNGNLDGSFCKCNRTTGLNFDDGTFSIDVDGGDKCKCKRKLVKQMEMLPILWVD
jgi:hypothetical protein